MANILVRSPRFETFTMSASSNSIKLELYIGGVLRYTIIKNSAPSSVVTFEIAELIRDYITQTFDGNYTTSTASTASSNVKQYTGQDGTGNQSSPTAIDHIAFNGYGTFMQGSNPTITSPLWMVSKDVIKNGYYVYYPLNTSGKIPIITNAGSISYKTFATDATSATLTGADTINIVRVDCTRYGDGNKITFVNKFGGLQDLWFFLKSVKATTSTKETYNANTISTSTGSATYSVNAPTKTVFNKTANQKIRLSSGYYPEGANPFFEELLLSDQVWLTQPDPYDPSTEQVVPVIISTSSFTYKTSLNDRLIEYTMDFDMAFDYINNVR
tara:strand:+ start:768 stop:1751 length:984 start_codon:yes stop_codon:yes gene_type:complete